MVSKVTLPWSTEAGYGAVAFDGTARLNEGLMRRLGLRAKVVEEGLESTRARVRRRVRLLRGERPFPDLSGRPEVLLVDDGLASGFTLRAGAGALRRAGARRLCIAVPTGHADAIDGLLPEVEAIYCVNVRGGRSYAVADAYQHWWDLDEEDVLRILLRHRRRA